MNNNDYVAPGEMPAGQILTPKEVIEASADLHEYRQLINRKLLQRGGNIGLIIIRLADLSNKAINQLADELKDAGWDVLLEDKTLNIC